MSTVYQFVHAKIMSDSLTKYFYKPYKDFNHIILLFPFCWLFKGNNMNGGLFDSAMRFCEFSTIRICDEYFIVINLKSMYAGIKKIDVAIFN
jgi:hypothetical protein